MEITLREVTKEAGVSIVTVSHVLTQHPGARVSAATCEKVVRAARQLDYRSNASTLEHLTLSADRLLSPFEEGRRRCGSEALP